MIQPITTHPGLWPPLQRRGTRKTGTIALWKIPSREGKRGARGGLPGQMAITVTATLLSVVVCRADMGAIPMKDIEIREPTQNAIILYDQGKKQEMIMLQTRLVSTRNAKGLFFMPLPSKPKVSTAKPEVFSRAVDFAKAKGVVFTLTDVWGGMHETLGPGGETAEKPKTKGLSVEFTKQVAEHDVTVIRVESWENVRQWLIQFVIDKHIPMEFDIDKIKDTVVAYAADGQRFFLFDVVDLRKEEQSTNPLVIDLESNKLYYPLRVNALYDGPSDVQLMVFSPTAIPKGRFSKIGFMESGAMSVPEAIAKWFWDGFATRSKGDLNFVCYYLPDPRTVYAEFHAPGDHPSEFANLRKCALARWNRDVSISLVWGKSEDPTYRIDPEMSLMTPGASNSLFETPARATKGDQQR